jgi:hypothetical protein
MAECSWHSQKAHRQVGARVPGQLNFASIKQTDLSVRWLVLG